MRVHTVTRTFPILADMHMPRTPQEAKEFCAEQRRLGREARELAERNAAELIAEIEEQVTRWPAFRNASRPRIQTARATQKPASRTSDQHGWRAAFREAGRGGPIGA
jgi:hypothetical protein